MSPYNPRQVLEVKVGDPPQRTRSGTDGSAGELPATNTSPIDDGSHLLECISIRQEAVGVKTFEFRLPRSNGSNNETGSLKWPFLPGQYASFEFNPANLHSPPGLSTGVRSQQYQASTPIMRTWTVSSHPLEASHTGSFNISIKRAGLVSSWLHDSLTPGMALQFRGFGGDFTPALLSTEAGAGGPARGVLLLAAGIGITPIVPILRDLLLMSPQQGATTVRRDPPTPILVCYWVRTAAEAAFAGELAAMVNQAAGAECPIHLLLCVTDPTILMAAESGGSGAKQAFMAMLEKNIIDSPHLTFAAGRISSAMLSSVQFSPALGGGNAPLSLTGWQSMACGPSTFMKAVEAAAVVLGIVAVHTESFSY